MLKLYVCMNGCETLSLDEEEFLLFRLNDLGKNVLSLNYFLQFLFLRIN